MGDVSECWNYIKASFNLPERIIPEPDGHNAFERRHFVGCAVLVAILHSPGSCVQNITTHVQWLAPQEGTMPRSAHANYDIIANFAEIIERLGKISEYLSAEIMAIAEI
jgi:hypothetical protein